MGAVSVLQWTDEIDLTDWWVELTDPENAFGEVATGLFDVYRAADEYPAAGGHGQIHWRHSEAVSATMVGIRVEGSGHPRIYGRDRLIAMAGANALARAEAAIET